MPATRAALLIFAPGGQNGNGQGTRLAEDLVRKVTARIRIRLRGSDEVALAVHGRPQAAKRAASFSAGVCPRSATDVAGALPRGLYRGFVRVKDTKQ